MITESENVMVKFDGLLNFIYVDATTPNVHHNETPRSGGTFLVSRLYHDYPPQSAQVFLVKWSGSSVPQTSHQLGRNLYTDTNYFNISYWYLVQLSISESWLQSGPIKLEKYIFPLKYNRRMEANSRTALLKPVDNSRAIAISGFSLANSGFIVLRTPLSIL